MKQIVTLLTFAGILFLGPPVLNAQVCFTPKVSARVDIDPVALCPADFNGDNKPDLAVVYKGGGASHISVFLNNGMAGFSTSVHFPVGVIPTSMCTADFNGDGKADLVVNSAGPGTVTVFPGNGNGTFDTLGAQTYGTLVFSTSAQLCSADFSGDGKADLVLSSGLNFVWKAIGDGLGGFLTYRRITVDNGTHCVASADFNGDGKQDLAVTTFNASSHVSVLLNRGMDSFSTATNFSVGDGPTSIITTDLNNDGKMDIVTSNSPGTVSVLLGDGTGSFAAATNIGIGTATTPKFMCAADFNGDGNKDLAIACVVNNSVSNITVLAGNGNGRFAPAVTFASDSFANGIVTADFNGDGRMDLAQTASVTNNDSGRLDVLLNCVPTAIGEVAGGTKAYLYPNPGTGIFHLNAQTEISRITITNQLGAIIYTSHINSKKWDIDLGMQARGIYFYRLENKAGALEQGKIIIR